MKPCRASAKKYERGKVRDKGRDVGETLTFSRI